MPIKSVRMKISKKKKKNSFFLMSQQSLDPKIRFLGQKVCSVARVQTDDERNSVKRKCVLVFVWVFLNLSLQMHKADISFSLNFICICLFVVIFQIQNFR